MDFLIAPFWIEYDLALALSAAAYLVGHTLYRMAAATAPLLRELSESVARERQRLSLVQSEKKAALEKKITPKQEVELVEKSEIFVSHSLEKVLASEEDTLPAEEQWEIMEEQAQMEVELPTAVSEMEVMDADTEASAQADEKSPVAEAELKRQLSEIAKHARGRLGQGLVAEARARIIEGLTLDKNHYELTSLLGQTYEAEGNYRKAEIIYKDLVESGHEDKDILSRLANAIAMQDKYDIALVVYERLRAIDGNNFVVVLTIAHLHFQLKEYEKAIEAAKYVLRAHPRNADMLTILAEGSIAVGEKKEALDAYQKLSNLNPYDGEVSALVSKLKLEIELGNNFRNNWAWQP